MKKYVSNLLEMLKEGLGYQTKPKITRRREEAEQKLLKNGWVKEEHPWGTIYIDRKSPEREDAYAFLQRKALGL